MLAPNPTCPICGAALQAIANVEAPPWICVEDAQAYYNCELTAAARQSFRPSYRDFYHQSNTLRQAAQAEQAVRRRS